MQRDIVLDTETTGLDPRKGDRLIEIGCIEMVNRIATGREYHRLINPEGRDVHPDAERIHGISTASLADKPLFKDVVDEFLQFIGRDGTLVIHNANFDMGFINMELDRLGRPPVTPVALSELAVIESVGASLVSGSENTIWPQADSGASVSVSVALIADGVNTGASLAP